MGLPNLLSELKVVRCDLVEDGRRACAVGAEGGMGALQLLNADHVN